MLSEPGAELLPSRRWGAAQPEKPTLVLLHGLYGHSAQWWLYVRALLGAFDVVALDMRNHGEAFHAPTQRHEEMADDVLRTLNAMGVGQFWLVGHSMGGRVAMRIAQRECDRVLGCVSLDAPIPTEAFSIKLEHYHQRVVQLLRDTEVEAGMPRQELRRRLLERRLDSQMAGYALRNYVLRSGKWGWRVGFEGISDHVFNRLSEPLDGAPITCPFLLLEAERSILCRHITVELFARFAPNGTRRVGAGESHLSLLFNPAMVVEWLRGVSG